MNGLPQEDPIDIPPNPWQLDVPIPSSEDREVIDERFASALVSPFPLGPPDEVGGEIETGGQMNGAPHALEDVQAEIWEASLTDEAPGGTLSNNTAAFDPYAGIRLALSSEYAALGADQIGAVLGPRRAIVALYGLLAQPELTRALLALLLGKTGRSSLPVNGADRPDPPRWNQCLIHPQCFGRF